MEGRGEELKRYEKRVALEKHAELNKKGGEKKGEVKRAV